MTEAKQGKEQPKPDPFESYEDLVAYLREQPMTWYPALIVEMVEAAYKKKVFLPGGASTIIAKWEEKNGRAHANQSIKQD